VALAVGATAVLVAGAAVLTAVLLRADVGPAPEVVARAVVDPGTEPGDGPAPAWDPRLEPLAQVVADLRGRPFPEPVAVEFLDDEGFREAIASANGELDDEDRAALDASTVELRALGLVAPDADLLGQYDQLAGGGTLAFYDTETDVITVRGTELDAATRVTVVHELTHAWQDQHLDLDRLDVLDDVPAGNLRILAEGDATRVEDAYVASLPAGERDEYLERSAEMGRAALDELGGVPDVLQASFGLPYAVGPPFVEVLEEEGGNAAVDEAMVDPPATEAEVLDPTRYLQRVGAVAVEAPAVPDGVEILDEGPFGALSLVLTLSERLDPRDALAAVDGWAGDASVVYRDGGRPCTVVAAAGADAAATAGLVDAFGSWAAAGPPGAASAEAIGGRAVLRSCEPDGGSVPSGQRVVLGLQYAALRLTVFEQVLSETPVELDAAACFAGEVAARVEPDELLSGTEISAAEGQRRGTEAAIACFD
jgi:hypothetical protein